MQTSSTKTLTRFLGLNNVADPLRGTAPGTREHQSWEWQSLAENVDCTDSYGIELRDGYTSHVAASSITGSYSSFDYSKCYIIDAGALKRVNTDGTTTTLYGTLTGTAYWSEQNDIVYVSCGTDKLRIKPDNTVTRWGVPTPAQPAIHAANGALFAGLYQAVLTYTDATGREGGACAAVEVQVTDGGFTISNIPQLSGYTPQLYMTEADGTVFYHIDRVLTDAYTVTSMPLGPELTTQFLDEPPEAGSYIAFLGANAYMAEYIQEIDQTVVWFSEAFSYHLFNLNTSYIVVPGEVTQMHGAAVGLIITTQNRIFAYDNDKLTQLAEYGAVPGQHADVGSDGKVYFWSKRGLCRALPFENITESAVSVAPGVLAGGGIINSNGYVKYVAVLNQGGSAFNIR